MKSFNPHQLQQILERHAWRPNFPPASDRGFWDRARHQAPASLVQEITADAERALTEAPAFLPASTYLKFRDNGDRKEFEALLHARGRATGALALAECFENSGRYLARLQDYIWAACEQSTWSYPAHLPELPDPLSPHIDLCAAMTGLTLSEVWLLLGDRFEPAISERLRFEIDRRLWTPYLKRHDFFWQFNSLDRTVNNWTAVCTAGVLGSAINFDLEPVRLSEIIDRGLRSLSDYLGTFDPDGGSTEGPGYWDYGFGYYSIIGQILAQRTGDVIDLFAGEDIFEIAQFPLRTRLSEGHYVTFSDCSLNVQMEPALLELLAQRLDLPQLRGLIVTEGSTREGIRGITWLLRDLAWRNPDAVRPTIAAAPHTWFRGMHWMITRDDPADPETLTLAIKGGHNNEMHNQNDVGSLIVHVGGESLLADVGRGKYTRQYFGPERYHHLVNNSRGHSVPVVAGFDQPAGETYRAEVVEHSHTDAASTLVLDMKAAYPPAAELTSLERTATMDRTQHRITLVDRFAFGGEPKSFESVLITLDTVTPASDHVIVQGQRHALRIAFDAATTAFQLETVPAVELDGGPADIHRLKFSPRTPVTTGEIRLTIERRA
jgi:hypothetical protein